MKQRKGIVVAALVHLIVWGGLLLFFVLGTICYALSKTTNSMDVAILYMFTIFVGVGFLTGLLLFFSVRSVCRPASAEKRPLQKIALGFSTAAMASFYAFIILLFGVNKDELFAVYLALAILWLVCAVIGGVVMLLAQRKRDHAIAKEAYAMNARKVIFGVLTTVCVLFVACPGILLLVWNHTSTWIWTAEYEEYASEFNIVKDYVLENYASEEGRILVVTTPLSAHGRTLYDRDMEEYAELPENVPAALDAIDENAFPYKHSDLDTIRIRGARVDFCISYGTYRLVYSPDEKPTWFHDPDENEDIKVKRIKDGWYHVVRE